MPRNCALEFCGRPVFSAQAEEEYCLKCRDAYSPKALAVMRYFNAPLGSALIKAAKLFPSAQGISDYFGVSLPTLYAWIRSYHGLSFRQFKRKYICTARTCIVVDNCAARYAWKYTVADRVHDRKGCICFIEGSDRLIMTTLTPSTMSEILHAEVCPDAAGIYVVENTVRRPKICASLAEPDCDDCEEEEAPSRSCSRKASRRR